MTDLEAGAPPVDPSSYPDYPTRCLMCGAALTVIAFAQSDTPPWACEPCGRAYWPAELRAARDHPDLFDPTVGFLSDERTIVMLASAEGEAVVARRAGTSLLREQMHMVDDGTLTFWRNRQGVASYVVHQIDAHLTFRHYKPPTPPKPTKAPARKRTAKPKESK